MAEAWTRILGRWTEAGLLDEATAERIRAFEQVHAGSNRLRWPIWIALTFGALALGAGVLLFVSAHWDALSPSTRFSLVVGLVALFHLAAAAVNERFPALATALHAVGTVALGGGIFLAGQIFNLDEHWPGGLMLWAIGAAIAWALLREWPQLGLTALLIPGWLVSEWIVATDAQWSRGSAEVVAGGLFLLALAYLTAMGREHVNVNRRTLTWIGGISFVPIAIGLAFVSADRAGSSPPNAGLLIVGATVALVLPVLLAFALQRIAAWPMIVAVLWVVILLTLRPLDAGTLSLYAWWALGAIALAAWGVGDARAERINIGAAVFVVTVLAFYFSEVMDKLERSASLIGLGLVFLGGGWLIEKARRRLVLRVRGGVA